MELWFLSSVAAQLPAWKAAIIIHIKLIEISLQAGCLLPTAHIIIFIYDNTVHCMTKANMSIY